MVELRVYSPAASSKSHRLPRSATPRTAAAAGDDDFHFAPGPQLDPGPWTLDAARHDRVKLRCDFYNPSGAIGKAKLELFVAREKSAVWTRDLKGDELRDGEQDLEFVIDNGAGGTQRGPDWDGGLRGSDDRLRKGSRFPDGYLTIEHSPYKLKLTVEGEGLCRSPVAWTYLHVLVDKLELEYGTMDMLPTKRDHRRTLFQEVLNAGTAPTADTKICLDANLFKASAGEMFNNHLFNTHRDKWGRGPKLPLCARIHIRSSADAPVLAPLAIGTSRFLWDWESRSAATGETFTDQAMNYDVDKTKPKGRNCHKDRGGKRGKGDDVFPAQPGYAPPTVKQGQFPFKVKSAGKPREWAAMSQAWREGPYACKTGVVFQPARMAGDKYRLTVYSAHERKPDGKRRLDVDTDAPLPIAPALKAVSGEFEIWRRIDVVRYMQKSNFASFSLAVMKAYYEPAFVELRDQTGGNVEVYPSAEWNTRLAAILGRWTVFERLFVDGTIDQYAAGSEGVILRSRADAETHLEATFPAEFSNPGDADTWLTAQGIPDDNALSNRFQQPATDAMTTLFNHKIHANNGVNIFHVRRVTSLVADHMGTLAGLAHDFPGAKRAGQKAIDRCGFLLLIDNLYWSAAGQPAELPQTAAHECGHHFMLPHPRNTAENTDKHANRDYKAHDETVDDCLMSYRDGVNKLCGFCRLRLRGWDKGALKTDGARNEKT
ncbi:MAG: hypothetical protein KF683_13620 [Rubrivivax sp.]|nr:hypothetical protein [Rubrivivax sp.]